MGRVLKKIIMIIYISNNTNRRFSCIVLSLCTGKNYNNNVCFCPDYIQRLIPDSSCCKSYFCPTIVEQMCRTEKKLCPTPLYDSLLMNCKTFYKTT